VLIIAAGLWAYHNSFHGPFIFDDKISITWNPSIRHLWPIWKALTPPHGMAGTVEGRPLLNLSLAVNYAVGGTRPLGYHIVNLAIHIAAGLVLYGIVRRTLLQPRLRQRFGMAAGPLALVIAVIWVVHPLQTESVAYIAQRAESMMGLFYLLTLYCAIRGAEGEGSPREGTRPATAQFIRGVGRSGSAGGSPGGLPASGGAGGDQGSPSKWFCLSVVACFLGMATKEVMVSAPVMVLLYDRAFIAGTFREAWRRRRWLYVGLGATWVCLAWLVVSAERFSTNSAVTKFKGISWWAYLLTEPGVIVHYLRLSVWPEPLCLDYFGWPTPRGWASILPSAMVIVGLLAAGAWAWRTSSNPLATGPAWGFLTAWFFLILGPTSSLIPADSPAYEHRMYLPLAAVVATVVLGAFELGKRFLSSRAPGGRALPTTRQGLMLAAGASGSVVLLFASLTIQRNRDYSSELTIWQDTVTKRPNNSRAHNNLGFYLARQGRLQAAIGHYEQALRLRPDHPDAQNNLGIVLMGQGRPQEAIGHYERALRLRPGYAEAHINLGAALFELGRPQEAIRHYEQALRINPDYAGGHYNLGVALAGLGWMPEAIEQYEQTLRLEPASATAHYSLAMALLQAGKVSEAIRHYEQALRIKPDDAEAHYNLGVVLGQAGRMQEAIEHWEQAVRLDPDYAGAHNDLGAALAGQGKLQEAIGQYEQALGIQPDYAEAHNNLGAVLRKLGRLQEAIGHYEQALRIKPDDAQAHNNLGAALLEQGRLQEAIRHWEQALQLAPDSAITQFNLGLALEKLGRRQEAIQHYEEALRIKPDLIQAQTALARAQAAR